METNGFIRRVDDLGRIVIPKEIRKKLKIADNSPLEIFSDSSTITIKKPQHACAFCGSTTKLLEISEKYICSKCINKINKIKSTK